MTLLFLKMAGGLANARNLHRLKLIVIHGSTSESADPSVPRLVEESRAPLHQAPTPPAVRRPALPLAAHPMRQVRMARLPARGHRPQPQPDTSANPLLERDSVRERKIEGDQPRVSLLLAALERFTSAWGWRCWSSCGLATGHPLWP